MSPQLSRFLARFPDHRGWRPVPGAIWAAACMAFLLHGTAAAGPVTEVAKAPSTDPGYRYQRHHTTVDSPSAWDVRSDSTSVVVAVLDSGVHLNHEDIKKNLWKNSASTVVSCDPDKAEGPHGYDFLGSLNNGARTGACDPDPSAEKLYFTMHGDTCLSYSYEHALRAGVWQFSWEIHGTNVAGVIGAGGDNGYGVTGMTWNVQIMPIRVADGVCGAVDETALISGIKYAIRKGADILNLSLGGFENRQSLKPAFELAAQSGVLIVAAAGNEATDLGTSPKFPASYSHSNLIVVGGTDVNGTALWNNSLGGGMPEGSNFNPAVVHIAAPAEVYSTSIRRREKFLTDYYEDRTGTSFSTPIVSGLAALLMQDISKAQRRQSAAAIKMRIILAATKQPGLDGKVASGLVNAKKTLQPAPPPQPLAPQISQAPSLEGTRYLSVDQAIEANGLNHIQAFSNMDRGEILQRFQAAMSNVKLPGEYKDKDELAKTLTDNVMDFRAAQVAASGQKAETSPLAGKPLGVNVLFNNGKIPKNLRIWEKIKAINDILAPYGAQIGGTLPDNRDAYVLTAKPADAVPDGRKVIQDLLRDDLIKGFVVQNSGKLY